MATIFLTIHFHDPRRAAERIACHECLMEKGGASVAILTDAAAYVYADVRRVETLTLEAVPEDPRRA